jgi:hypothetical protein
VPRYATPAGAQAATQARERAQAMAAERASGIPLELIGLVTPLPADGEPVPGEIVEHQAHAIGGNPTTRALSFAMRRQLRVGPDPPAPPA